MPSSTRVDFIPIPTQDVARPTAVYRDAGVTSFGETFGTGVCHMALFADPDGNPLMLHWRYAPGN
jgi:hypothetical protein